MKNAWVFPGQGSQKVGMGQAWQRTHVAARRRFDQASQVLGYDLAKLCFEGPVETLTQTLHAQPALLTVGVIALDLAREHDLEAQMTAGHSLGEYSALVAANVLEFEDALRLVQQRAQLMDNAPAGTMAALIGLKDDALEQVLESAGQAGVVVGANFNSPGQIVVSGEEAAVERAMSEAKVQGAKMAIRLPVSGAFHSPLMQSAGETMATLIEAAPFQDARIPVYCNTTARSTTDASELKKALSAQMTGAVLWSQSVQQMIADGAEQFIELGPGKVLCGLVGRIDKSVQTQFAESWE